MGTNKLRDMGIVQILTDEAYLPKQILSTYRLDYTNLIYSYFCTNDLNNLFIVWLNSQQSLYSVKLVVANLCPYAKRNPVW